MINREPVLEIIIPNWNGREMLQTCMQSLEGQSRRDFIITVVDNGSEDDSVAYLRRCHPQVNIIEFGENMGFSVAVNAGIRQSAADWILLLNNDIEVDPNCIASLYEGVDRHPDHDFFALKMLSYHRRDMVDGAGDAVLRGGVGYRVGTLERDQGQYDEERDVFGACAGAALYSKKFFDTVGLFDEDFFAYLEDVDLNMRAVRAGLKCRYLASAVVYHIGSATSGSKINPLTIRLSTRNNINILVKNYSLPLIVRFLPAILIYQLMWFFFTCKKGQLLPYCQGVLQGLGQLGTMVRKRALVRRLATLSTTEFSRLLAASEQEAVRSIMYRRAQLGKGNVLLLAYMRLFL